MNKVTFYLVDFFKTSLRIFFVYLSSGYDCVICGKTNYIKPVCPLCTEKYFNIKKTLALDRCEVCGKTLISCERICSQCKENQVYKNVDYVIPLFSYRLWNKELMFMWKNNGERCLSAFFARLIAEALKEIGCNIVVPVPPRPGKIKEKGWDQIDEVCMYLKYKYGYKLLPVLERRTVKQQKKLNRKDRLETIGNSYFLKSDKEIGACLNRIKSKVPDCVCIIDDVCTTGSTIESCGSLLKNMGIKRVEAITLFAVD